MTESNTGEDSEATEAHNLIRNAADGSSPPEAILVDGESDDDPSLFDVLGSLRVWDADGRPVKFSSHLVEPGLVAVYGNDAAIDRVLAEIALLDERLAPSLWLSFILPATVDPATLPAPIAGRTKYFLDRDRQATSQLPLNMDRLAYAVCPDKLIAVQITVENGMFLLEHDDSIESERGTDRMIDLGDVFL